MSTLPELRAGVYRHYKGKHYLALGYGHDANVENRTTVHYVGLELDMAQTGERLATRTAISNDPNIEAWWDFVHSDGSKCLHRLHTKGRCSGGKDVQQRFTYIGPSLGYAGSLSTPWYYPEEG